MQTIRPLRKTSLPSVLKRLSAVLLLSGLGAASATDFNLSLTKTASVSSVTAGGSVNFSIKVSNAGPYAATNVVIQDALPKGFKLVSASPTFASSDATSDPKITKYYFNLGSISAGTSKTITISATAVASSDLVAPTIGGAYDYTNIAQVYSVDYSSYDSSGSRPNNCTYSTIQSGYGMEDDCAKVQVSVSGTGGTVPTAPVSGSCTATTPYVQSFNTAGALAEVVNHAYRTDPNVVTATDGTYTLWNSIDNTGNGGYAVYMNIANFEGRNGGTLTNPGLLYQSTVNVPAGSTVNYRNYVRSHSSTATQIRYVFTDTATGTVLQQYDGPLATTSYTQQTVPSFVAPGTQVTLRLYTLKDGTSTDTNVLKLDDLRLTCTVPATPQLTVSKSGNGPWSAGQSGANYTITVTNSSSVPTSGTVTVKDVLPSGVSPASLSLPSGWTSSISGQTVTLTTGNSIPAGASVSLSLPVTLSSTLSGSVTNKVSVGGGGDPDAMPDPTTCTPGTSNPQNQCAQYTTTVAAPPTTTCSNLYAMVITSSDAYNFYGGKIQRLDELTNTLTGSAIFLPYGATSATLAVSPDGTKFYTADDNDYLRIYNTATASWTTASMFQGVADRLVRMTMTPSGTGYAMDSSGNFWSFTQSGSTQYLGKLTSTSSTTPNFYANGDFFATSDGKLYMLSAQTGGTVNLWYVNPQTMKAEYLGNLTNATGSTQYNGLAATANGVFAANSSGTLGKVDPIAVTITPVGGTTTGSTDLASCYYPTYAPKVDGVKSVTKVAGSSGSDVRPGDTLEYTIVVRNSGTISAGGATFRDALPAGTTYVPDSARVNGFTSTTLNGTTVNLGGSAYPFTNSVGICSKGTTACTNQVLKVDTTPATIDNEAVITFRVTVNAGATSVQNTGIITYNDGQTPPTDIPTNPVVTPVTPYPQLSISKTSNAQNGTWTVGQSGAAYTLTVKNTSTSATSGTITVKDLLPAGLTYGTITAPSGWTCSVSAQLLTCTTSNVLSGGDSVAITVPVNVTGSTLGSLTNKAVVGGGGDPDAMPDPSTCTPGGTNPQNQCAAVPVTVSGAPSLIVTKTVKKVGSMSGSSSSSSLSTQSLTSPAVNPGDILEYAITVRNAGNVDATGVTFVDALPAGTTYVADTAVINSFNSTVTNGTTTSLAGSTYPFASPVGICSFGSAPCTTQTLKVDTTPTLIDNEAVIKFQVRVNDPFTLTPSYVSNQAIVTYPGGPSVPSDDPDTPEPNDPTITPVNKPAKLDVVKTVQNITAGTPAGSVGEGQPGDVLEYCIASTNTGSANLTKITFGDTVPANTTFLVGGYGSGQDIRVVSKNGTAFYTAAADTDYGLLNNGKVTVSNPSFVLQPTEAFTVCFRATIK